MFHSFAMFGARAQRDVGGACVDGIAHEVPERLRQAIEIAVHVRQRRIVIAHQAHGPACIGFRQAEHAFEHRVDVHGFEGARRCRGEQAIEQAREAIDFGFDERDEFGGGRIAGDAAFEQLRRALQAGERIAQLVREALQRSG